MITIMIVMMGCGKFSPTYILAQGSAEPSLTTSSSIIVQRCTVGEVTEGVLHSLRSEINQSLNEGVTLCVGRSWSHMGSFCG